jgi:hypothetical protein
MLADVHSYVNAQNGRSGRRASVSQSSLFMVPKNGFTVSLKTTEKTQIGPRLQIAISLAGHRSEK